MQSLQIAAYFDQDFNGDGLDSDAFDTSYDQQNSAADTDDDADPTDLDLFIDPLGFEFDVI